MASENKESPSIPISGIIGVLLIAVTIVTRQFALDSPRPAPQEPQRAHERAWLQDVDSRMWQDPMIVVAQHRDFERAAAYQREQVAHAFGLRQTPPEESLLPPDDRHPVGRVPVERGIFCKGTGAVRLVAAMVLGGPSEEEAEMRRRTRYAVVSGLMNAGYVPENADAIGYVYTRPDFRLRRDQALPETIPFEWFNPADPVLSGDGADGAGHDRLLLLWLDQSNYTREPLERLRELVRSISPRCPSGKPGFFRTTILGPVDSQALSALLDDIRKEADAGSTPKNAIPLEIVSASATGSLHGALIDTPSDSEYYVGTRTTDTLRTPYTTFVRVIGPDSRLSDALLHELVLRNLHVVRPRFPPRRPSVIVVNEHDTNYGRAFADHVQNAEFQSRFDVASFFYLRQIDGGRPASATPRERPAERESAQSQSNRYSRSHGSHHVDYLRRLVDEIRKYQNDPAQPRDVVAIAIFGNDVYDKLLVLRALKPAFPKALFLTTDLDARLLDAEESRWARNMIVATNYDLSLSRTLQRGAAPFRDGYQTATYFAALLIGGDCVVDAITANGRNPPWLLDPLLFEIGRTEPIALTAPAERMTNLQACAFPGTRLKEDRVQPAIARPEPPGEIILGLAAFLLGVCIALARFVAPLTDVSTAHPPVMRGFRDAKQWGAVVLAAIAGGAAVVALDRVMTAKLGVVFGLLCATLLCAGVAVVQEGLGASRRRMFFSLLVVIPALYLLFDTALPIFRANEEPFAWLEGVSVWPTHIIRLLAAWLAAFAIWRIGCDSMSNADEISARFGLASDYQSARPSEVARLWIDYVRARRRRGATIIFISICHIAACYVLILWVGNLPGTPVRGTSELHAVEKLLGFVVFMSVALLVAVAVAYWYFIVQVLRPLALRNYAFPQGSEIRRRLGLPDSIEEACKPFIDRVLAVELAADRSKALARFIYFPFAVFALMVVARSSLFDMWDMPPALALILTLPFVIVIFCVGWLRYETVKFHRNALDDMRTEMLRMRNASDVGEARRWQCEQLYGRVRNESRGSFQNIALQPLVRALLLPIGGFSGIEMLQHALLK